MSEVSKPDEMERCSFCGRHKNEVKRLFEGINANICIDCSDVVKEDFEFDYEAANKKVKELKKPYEIVNQLDKYIIGQDVAKRILSVAAYNHYKRVKVDKTVDIEKGNVLMVGPTGSGKTYLMRRLGEILDVPVVVADATSLTEAGYAGEDVDSIILRLLKAANMDVKKAEMGIIYIDEVDKIATRNIEGRKNSRDVSGEGVQQALLRILEDTDIEVSMPNAIGVKGKKVKINTRNILFVCGGAFSGIDKIQKERMNKKKSIGFTSEEEGMKSKSKISTEDFIEFGMIPEFLGRVPVVIELDKLEKEDLKRVFFEPKGSLMKQYVESFKLDNIELSFDEEAIEYIAELAYEKNMGARGLRGIIETYIYELTYKLIKEGITGEYILKKEMIEGVI